MLLMLLLLACGHDGKGSTDDSVSADDSGGTDDSGAPEEGPLPDAVLDQISLDNIQASVEYLASDALEGRGIGTKGHDEARDWLAEQMGALGLQPAGDDGGYVYSFDLGREESSYELDDSGTPVLVTTSEGSNVQALLPGSDPDRASELVVVMAHYDHLGAGSTGDIYNGAYDNATAAATLLELARVFVDEGVSFPRPILFVFTDGEETDLYGSAAWVADPTVPLGDVAVAFSVDPIGRGLLPDYWPLILLGLERCPELSDEVRAVARYSDADVAFVNRKPIPGYASDQDSFFDADSGVPAFWFVSPGFSFYHQIDDEPETIDYRTVRDHSRFLATLLADFGQSELRAQDQGQQELSVQDLADASALITGVLGSSELTEAERNNLSSFQSTFDADVESGEVNAASRSAYLSAAATVLLELTEAHPGDVPPPWPEE